jgi:hypothetical protein
MNSTYRLAMPQPSTETLEVFTTELAHDVLRRSIWTSVPPAFHPWSHGFDFVLDVGIPGLRFNVDIAPLAIEVGGLFVFVVSHLPVRVERLVAAGDCAGEVPDRIEWNVHIGGECVESWGEGVVVEVGVG